MLPQIFCGIRQGAPAASVQPSLISLLPPPLPTAHGLRCLLVVKSGLTLSLTVCEFIPYTRLCFLEHWDCVFLVLVTVLCNSECSITVVQTELKGKKKIFFFLNFYGSQAFKQGRYIEGNADLLPRSVPFARLSLDYVTV